MKLLSIQIPTIETRLLEFALIYAKLIDQMIKNKLEDKVEIIFLRDNKEMSIGEKRGKLYQMANAKFSVQIDDDDNVPDHYIKTIVDTIEKNPDCDFIGYYEKCYIDNQTLRTKHSNQFTDWGDYYGEDCRYGRTPFHKDPILTEYCIKVGVETIRFGEDQLFAKKLKASGLIKNEVFITDEMYLYQYRYEPHNSKYGIK